MPYYTGRLTPDDELVDFETRKPIRKRDDNELPPSDLDGDLIDESKFKREPSGLMSEEESKQERDTMLDGEDFDPQEG